MNIFSCQTKGSLSSLFLLFGFFMMNLVGPSEPFPPLFGGRVGFIGRIIAALTHPEDCIQIAMKIAMVSLGVGLISLIVGTVSLISSFIIKSR